MRDDVRDDVREALAVLRRTLNNGESPSIVLAAIALVPALDRFLSSPAAPQRECGCERYPPCPQYGNGPGSNLRCVRCGHARACHAAAPPLPATREGNDA